MSPLPTMLRRAGGREENLEEDQPVDELPPIADAAHQAGAHFAAKASSFGLLVCLALGPVGAVAGGLALAQASAAGPVAPAPVAERSNDQVVAAEFAQRVVISWLTATQSDPGELQALVKDAQLSTLSRVPFLVQDPAIARIEQVEGTWSVTVAATVTDARKSTARRYFHVPVRVAGTAVTALTLPAPVPPPVIVPAASGEYRVQLGAGGAPGQAVAQFLNAYLSGTGDVSRYLTPGVSLPSLTPAPYALVRLDDVRGLSDDPGADRDGNTLRVLAFATASVTDKQTASFVYALSLTARAGRWEITSIDPAPAFTPDAPASTPGAVPTSSGAGTTTPAGTAPASTTP